LLNIAFIWDNKDFFHTEKTTRFRLSSLSRLALDAQEADKVGIWRNYQEGDLAVNVMYEGGNLSHTLIESLRLVLDEFVRIRNEYASVMGDYAYGQRLFIGLERLKTRKGKITLPDDKVLNALRKIWRALVGQDFADMSDDICLRGKKTAKKLEAFQQMKGSIDDIYNNPNWQSAVRYYTREYYPSGFHALSGILETANFAEEAYRKKMEQLLQK